MNTLLYLFIFICSVTILLISTDIFVKLGVKISQHLKISSLVVGSTLIAVSTSLPELSVSITAVLRKDPGLALGNIVGSNISNIFLVFASAILMGHLRVGSKKTQRTNLFLLGYTFFFIAAFLLIHSILMGLILIMGAFVYSLIEYRWGIEGRTHEDAKQFAPGPKPKLSPKDFVVLLFCIGGITIGGLLITSSIEQLSKLLNITTTVLGLSVTAIATSLPELLTVFFSQKDHEEKLSIGNVIGSNIYNMLLIGGIIMILNAQPISINQTDWLFLIVAQIIFALVIIYYKGKVIKESTGWGLLLLLLLYLLTLG